MTAPLRALQSEINVLAYEKSAIKLEIKQTYKSERSADALLLKYCGSEEKPLGNNFFRITLRATVRVQQSRLSTKSSVLEHDKTAPILPHYVVNLTLQMVSQDTAHQGLGFA